MEKQILTAIVVMVVLICGGTSGSRAAQTGELVMDDSSVALFKRASGVTAVEVGRGHDIGLPGINDEEHDYWVDVGGKGLTELEVTTPWGEQFLASDYLPADWSGEYFEQHITARDIDFEAYADQNGTRWIEVEWENLPDSEWNELEGDAADLTVSYLGGSWTGAVDFSSSSMPTQVPEITYPSNGETGVDLQPTFTWEEWTSPDDSTNPGVWWELEESDNWEEVYEEDHATPDTTSWMPSDPLKPETQYGFYVDFHHAATVAVNGVEALVESYLESGTQFTTAASTPILSDLIATFPATPSLQAEPGQGLRLDVRVENIGDGDAFVPNEPQREWDTALYLSGDDQFAEDADTEVAEFALTKLAAGASETRTLSFYAPTEPGTYYLAAKADDFDTVPESDEGNNWSAVATLVVKAQANAIIATFDQDDEDWDIGDDDGIDPSEAIKSHESEGGNPGGHIRLADELTGGGVHGLRLYGPADFLGDLSALNGGVIGFDAKHISGTWETNARWGEIALRSPNHVATADIVDGDPPDDWQSFTAPFTAESFGVSETVWNELISNVTEFKLVADDNGGTEVTGYDNIRLLSGTVPEEHQLTDSNATARRPMIQTDNDNVYIVYDDDPTGTRELYFLRSSDGGEQWSDTQRLTSDDGVPSRAPALEIDANGTLHLAWRDKRGGAWSGWYMRSPDQGATWTDPVNVTEYPDAYEFTHPKIALASDADNLYLFWHDNRNQPDGVGWHNPYYRISPDLGESWGDTRRLTNERLTGARVAVATDGAGTLHVGWRRGYYDQEEALYKRSGDSGQSWGDDTVVAAINTSVVPCANTAGDVVLLYAEENALKYTYSNDRGETFTDPAALSDQAVNPGLSANNGAIDCHESVFATVWQDRRHNTGRSGENTEIYLAVSRDGGSSWTRETRVSHAGGLSSHAKLACDAEAMHVVWSDNRDGNYEIFYSRVRNDTIPADEDNDGMPDSWEQQIVDADPDDDIDSIEDVLPDDDFDGDGWSNLTEYEQGTDPLGWLCSLDVAGAGAGYSQVGFGMHAGARDGEDDAYDVDVPMAPPEGEAAVYFESVRVSYLRDIRPIAGQAEWLLVVEAGDETDVEFSWDAMKCLGATRHLSLFRVDEDLEPINGTFLNMKRAVELNVPAGESRQFLLRVGPALSVDIGFRAGWNLISLPFDPAEENGVEALLGDAGTSARDTFRDGCRGAIHTDAVWQWLNEGADGAYRYGKAATLEAFKGYWAYAEAPATVTVEGTPAQDTMIELMLGWNLLGPACRMTVPTPQEADLRVRCWHWDAEGQEYLESAEMLPCLGYWLNAGSDGVAVDVEPAAGSRQAPGTEARSSESRSLSPQVLGDDLPDLADGNTAFALDLYHAVNDKEGNLFMSPYSISVALAMTYAGARGDTETQMADTLHFNLTQDRLHPAFNKLDLELASRGENADGKDEEPFRLHIVNQLWGQKDYAFLPEFLDTLAVNYGAGLRLMDFMSAPDVSRIEINDWVADQTEQRIKNLIPQGGIDTLTRLALTNAIYFNAAWSSPFDVGSASDGTFTKPDGTEVTVPMMTQEQVYPYVDDDENVKAVELPYDGNELSMVLLIPDAGFFTDFEETLTVDELDQILGRLTGTNLRLTIPKFEFNATLSLAQTLAAMGMPAAFSTDANFSGMDGTGNLRISDVFHKAFVAVDESGTEAAAATAVVVGTTTLPPDPVELTIDRPFLFLIRDRKTGAILFLGRLTAPE